MALDQLNLFYALLRGDYAAADRHAVTGWTKPALVSGLDGLQQMYLYARKRISAKELLARSKGFKMSPYPETVNAFLAFAHFVNLDEDAGVQLVNTAFTQSQGSPLGALYVAWTMLWADRELNPVALKLLHETALANEKHGRRYVAAELADTLRKIVPQDGHAESWRQMAERFRKTHGYQYVNDIIAPRDPAEKLLALLQQVAEDDTAAREAERETRLEWQLDFKTEKFDIKWQRIAKAGGWTPGRTLTLDKLVDTFEKGDLDERDADFVEHLIDQQGSTSRRSSYSYYASELRIDFAKLVYLLVGHPHVVLAKARSAQVTIEKGEAALSVSETPDGLRVEFKPPGAAGEYAYEVLGKTRVTAYKLTPREVALAKGVGTGSTLPPDKRLELERALPKLREQVNVRSAIDLDDAGLDQVSGGTEVAVHLLPNESAYDAELLVRPIPDMEYYVVPGEGLERDIVVLDAEADTPRRVVLNRNIAGETAAAKKVVKACPALGSASDLSHQFRIEDPQQALQLVAELRDQHERGGITIEYPKGQRFKIAAVAKTNALNLNIGQQRDWFSVSGKVTVDENRVLDFAQLLQHTRDSKSRFVQMGEGEFVELSEELRQRLAQMEALLHQRGNGVAIPTLGANVFDTLLSEIGDLGTVEYDEEWTLQLDRVAQARKLRPRVPKDFDAELRDYQEDGYKWLMRLAAWGVGACLADDMGLGKTVQALAALTSRAGEGPALVLAPASVTRNWVRETKRFAPSLTAKLLASSKETNLIDEVGDGDVLIVSYGLVPYIEAELQAKHFATIILDEAQAIKNPASQRAKAAFGLSGDFKIVTTGTPIENNLIELWSLFRFLNPGLLGSREAFAGKYARPMAIAGGDTEVLRDQLRNLVQPFILRRRKDDVLKELPAKTEIILEVEPTEAERALYEAMRREALEEMANASPQEQRFVILKQLTRLRQAACHPKLVRPSSKLESSKLALVGETIQELLDNGHKALVFSQFVKHLKLVEAWVRAAKIPYRYLDGSTPGKKREQLVQEFQAGDAQLFLISLKAGGTGLNLTAADYVLHLDPWWNPAVEDQASDRAHRMGQQRPVTVYRFVTLGTIEEKIIDLHAEKRDLADQILAGTDASASLSVDQMVAMLGS